MKKTTVLLIIALSLLSYLNAVPRNLSSPVLISSLYSSPADDSLLYDGHFGNRGVIPGGECDIKVTYASGTTGGSKNVVLTVTTCGVTSTTNQIQSGPVNKDDILAPGSEIYTGSDGKIELTLGDGSVIRMGPNTSLKITQEHCVSTGVFLKAGSIWTKIKKIFGGGKFEVTTERACACVRGTEFTVEATENYSVTTVFEGAVEVSLRTGKNVYEKDMKELEKLQKDLQEGKVSMEEFGRKMEEYSRKMEETSKTYNEPKIIEAGNKITVEDAVKGPEPFEKKTSNWFDESNFR